MLGGDFRHRRERVILGDRLVAGTGLLELSEALPRLGQAEGGPLGEQALGPFVEQLGVLVGRGLQTDPGAVLVDERQFRPLAEGVLGEREPGPGGRRRSGETRPDIGQSIDA